jgi:hypothetical protein
VIRNWIGAVSAIGLAVSSSWLAAAEITPEQAKHFESKIRPLLVERCQSCHGPDKQKSGLRVDSRSALLEGGESGAAIDPENPEDSLFLGAIRYESLEMPPDRKLPGDEIRLLTDWIKDGAYWPGSDAENSPQVRKPGFEITEEDRRFWSFVAPQVASAVGVSESVTNETTAAESVAPSETDWPTQPIDEYILQPLRAAGFTPSPMADRKTLLRRLSFDLLGLPPTYEELEAFAADHRPNAYEQKVDEYLHRPEYGERWGRHWLDLVRFAQTNGYERDDEKPEAWRYRDYVISAWNSDKPYDRFVQEQLAGDQLHEVTDEGRIALGFYRLGVWDDEPDDARQARFDELDDMLSTTGSVFLGLTIGCARCHDHKFDPIPQADYYSLLAFMRGIKGYVKAEDKTAGEAIFANLQSGGRALTVHEMADPEPTHILARGSAASPGQAVSPRFPQVLTALVTTPSQSSITDGAVVAGEGGAGAESASAAATEAGPADLERNRRRALAEWITRPDHPLTPRVLVNRLWHYHFGKGLVATPNDFGKQGLPPTHPALLDYLATELVRHDWHIKPLQRQIVLSATYRQSSANHNAAAHAVDPDNRLLWRQNLRRLEAEAIRDSMLTVAGNLNPQLHGRGVFPTLPPEVLATQSRPGAGWDESSPAEQCRRSVYVFVKRTLGVPILESFDVAAADSSQANRNVTTIAPQALILLNSRFAQDQAVALAQRIGEEAGGDPVHQIRRAFQLTLSRDPSPAEQGKALAYLQRVAQETQPDEPLLVQVTASQSAVGWSYWGGEWQLSEGPALHVASDPGGKALWNGREFDDGEVSAMIRLNSGHDAGLLLRASNARLGTDALSAYNINVQRHRIRIGKHLDNWREMISAPAEFPPGEWQTIRVTIKGAQLDVYLGDESEPLLSWIDAQPLPAGRIGFRTFNADAELKNVTIRTAAESVQVPILPTDRAPAVDSVTMRGLVALSRVLMNLNEFVYVD